MRDDLLEVRSTLFMSFIYNSICTLVYQVLELYPEFAESFAQNLKVTFSMRDDEVTGVDPSVFRRYFREEGAEEGAGSEAEELGGGAGGDTSATHNRAEVRDYKMPRRKTTRRRKPRKPPDSDRWGRSMNINFFTAEVACGSWLMLNNWMQMTHTE